MVDRASEKERKKREREREEETGGSEMHLARGHGNKPTTKMGKAAQNEGDGGGGVEKEARWKVDDGKMGSSRERTSPCS